MGKKVIALDIGGTNTRAALVDEDYRIISEKINPTIRGDKEAFLKNIIATVHEAVSDFSDVIGIGGGLPGRVRYDGYIYILANVGITDIPLAKTLQDEFSLPVALGNDAEMASLAEANLGAYKNEPSLFFVTISSGVGGAFTSHGRFCPSSDEVGHTLTPYKGKIYEFEHLCSGNGIPLLSSLSNLKVNNSKEFFDLVARKDPLALAVYKDWLSLLAGWINMNQKNFSPAIFTITGGVSKASSIFLPSLRLLTPNSHLELCSFKEEAGLMGAAVKAFQSFFH